MDKAIRVALISVGVIFAFVMLVLPLATVLQFALRDGFRVFIAAISGPLAQQALLLTLQVAAIALVVNTVFGTFAAWTISKYRFRGKQALTTIIDLPFSISTVIAGLMFVLIFGRFGWAQPFLQALDLRVVAAFPGIVLVTIFVTFPFVSRELLPIMQTMGSEEEEAAALMGAGGFRIFRSITLPHAKWGLLYGMILATARAMGEFGAARVISGGVINTLPLQVEILFFNQVSAAFGVASILVMLSILILIVRSVLEHKMEG
jgi:sulfate transport system permease protein